MEYEFAIAIPIQEMLHALIKPEVKQICGNFACICYASSL